MFRSEIEDIFIGVSSNFWIHLTETKITFK
jgi:hypothetical protein